MFKILLFCLFCQAYGFLLPDESLRSSSSRIVGGVPAPDGAVPYQASLRSASNSHFCGGSILNNRWILTAAHCTAGQSPPYSIQVVVGTNSLKSGGDRYEVHRIISHEDGDISLIMVKEDITFSDRVQPIALPEENTPGGRELMLSGWGTTSYPGSIPTDLQMINLTSLSVERCQEIYNNISPVDETQICSLTKAGEGACHGDSGGPLVEGNAQVGIVSWGIPCARGYPDVYTRVFSFKDWIQDQMSD